MTYLAALGMHICVYIFCYNQTPPKEGRTATPCSRLILYLSFLSSAGLALLENFSSEQDRNAFAPPLQRHWLNRAAKPRPLGYKRATRSWNSSSAQISASGSRRGRGIYM